MHEIRARGLAPATVVAASALAPTWWLCPKGRPEGRLV